jgi:hypothetical protein
MLGPIGKFDIGDIGDIGTSSARGPGGTAVCFYSQVSLGNG